MAVWHNWMYILRKEQYWEKRGCKHFHADVKKLDEVKLDMTRKCWQKTRLRVCNAFFVYMVSRLSVLLAARQFKCIELKFLKRAESFLFRFAFAVFEQRVMRVLRLKHRRAPTSVSTKRVHLTLSMFCSFFPEPIAFELCQCNASCVRVHPTGCCAPLWYTNTKLHRLLILCMR